MSATVGTALKKIAVAVLMDRKSRGKIVVFLLAIVCIVLLLLMGVQAVFTDGELSREEYDALAESAVSNLSEETRAELSGMEQTTQEVQQLLEAKGCDARQVRGAQVLYLLALYDHNREPGFAEKLAGCFAPDQTDDGLIAAVNAAFGTELTAEDYAALLLLAYKELVQVAISQIGNVGGERYWRWYGFTEHVDWCACFVSWCADQCGYIDAGRMPKFSGCGEGANWFKQENAWKDKDDVPSAGDLIFFDWADPVQDGEPDHVGIVTDVRDGRVYTVEGNADDRCNANSYPVGYAEIYGYGVPGGMKEGIE